MTKPFALFDVDGVLVQPYLIKHFSEYLVAHNAIDPTPFQSFGAQMRTGTLTYEAMSRMSTAAYATSLTGRSVAAIRALAVQFWEENSHLLYPHTRPLLRLLQPHYRIVLISGAPEESLLPFKRWLGVDVIFATTVAQAAGTYTGDEIVSGGLYEAKQAAVESLAIDTKRQQKSLAFGDNPRNDRPLLEAAQFPHLLTHGEVPSVDELRQSVPNLRVIEMAQSPNALQASVEALVTELFR